MHEKENAYNGFLYVGLMIENNEPYLIEYNIRMGDQVSSYTPKIKNRFSKNL